MLNTLRWANEIRPWTDIKLPAEGSAALKASELKMAMQLITDMTAKWQPDTYADNFTQAVQALVAKRLDAGGTAKVEPMEALATGSDNVVNLTALLRQSLKTKPSANSAARATTAKPAAKNVGRKRA